MLPPTSSGSRLVALRATGLLDAAASPLLDGLARIATRALGVPSAMVTLVDDQHHWCAGRAVNGPALDESSISLASSFCRRVVTGQAPLLIPDSRLASLEEGGALDEPLPLRAYAGVPLTTETGDTLGAFCVTDTVPREWTGEDVANLEDLARAAVAELELRIALTARRTSEARLAGIIESATDAIVTTDERQRIVLANSTAERLFGYAASELLGQSLDLLIPEDRRARHHEHVERFGADGMTTRSMGRHGSHDALVLSARRRDGSTFPIDASISQVMTDEGRLFTVILRDVSARVAADEERARVEDALRESEARARVLFRDSPMPMWVFDLETLRIRDVNSAAIARYGYSYEEFRALSAADLRPAEDVPEFLASVAEPRRGVANIGVFRHRAKSGEVFSAKVTAQSTTYDSRAARIVLCEDITAQVLLESQLRQAQKMEAVGLLAGGIAHDFNNLLTIIQGNLAFVRSELADDHPVRRDLDEVYMAGERAVSLVRQLLTFSRQQPVRPEEVQVASVVRQAESLLRRVIGEEITLHVTLPATPTLVRVDRGQLEQLLMNLAVNARDAMLTPLHGHLGRGGTLRIDVDTTTLHLSDARLWGDVAPGRWVRIQVRDTGHGMTAETQAHAFEPFFTTKAVGSGTGLGLSTVFGIVRKAGGAIRLESSPGNGSTFTILLPELADSAAPRGDAAAPSDSEAVDTGVTILLVEDETGVRVTARRILERRGYTVLEASNGIEALAMWREWHNEIDVVVTDLRMPKLGGRDLIERLAADRPDLPVVLFSGYSDLQDVPPPRARQVMLSKPFTGEELHAAVAAVRAVD